MYPCTLILEHTVLKGPSAKFWRLFLPVRVKGLSMSSFYRTAVSVHVVLQYGKYDTTAPSLSSFFESRSYSSGKFHENTPYFSGSFKV